MLYDQAWIYPISTALGGVIAGIGKHIICGAIASLKKSEEYQESLKEESKYDQNRDKADTNMSL